MRRSGAPRAPWLLASTSAAALLCWSEAAFAACETPPTGGVLAVAGETSLVSGTFATSANDAIAGQATGVGALISGPEEGTVAFSTIGAAANALQADNGGAISLAPTVANPGTVTTAGAGSFGIFATGSAETEGGSVASQINIENINVSTSGAAVAGGPTANGIEIDNGAIAKITSGSVTTASTANGAVGVAATGGSQITISGTTITSNGNGSQGLFVTGSGSSLSGYTLTVIANGSYDSTTGFYAGAASNNALRLFHGRDALHKQFDVDDDRDADIRRLYGERRDNHA